MEVQNYKNHRRFIPLFHYALLLIVFAINIISFFNLYFATKVASGRMEAGMLVLMGLVLTMFFFFFRGFPLRAQDRAIRAEENLRHFVLTGKLHDKGLTLGQIIALRFADDEEFVALSAKALKENMSNDDIKKAIKKWKADHHRA
jgi:uncharacterized membrane protein (DUF485 family)